MSRSITRALGIVSSQALVRIFFWLLPVAVLTLVPLMPARADFFDDARRTFKIEIPRFFEHDIPCALGTKPAGHSKTSCKSSDHLAKRGSRPRLSPQAAMHRVAPRHQESPRVVRSFRGASGQPCRVVDETVLIDGEKTQATGTVCKQSDGRWTIAAADADIAHQLSQFGALDADVVSAKGQPMR